MTLRALLLAGTVLPLCLAPAAAFAPPALPGAGSAILIQGVGEEARVAADRACGVVQLRVVGGGWGIAVEQRHGAALGREFTQKDDDPQ